MTTTAHTPAQLPATEIKIRTRSRVLEVAFEDGAHFLLPFEYLRVHSPSAEVKGHGPGQEVLVTGKRDVGIGAVEPSVPSRVFPIAGPHDLGRSPTNGFGGAHRSVGYQQR